MFVCLAGCLLGASVPESCLPCGSLTAAIESSREEALRQLVAPIREELPQLPRTECRRRDGRVAEGARLESVFTRKGNVGSNPTLSAIFSTTRLSCDPKRDPLSAWQSQTHDLAVRF